MYSYEIDNYLKEREYRLNSEEIIFITDITVNTQICRISYNQEFNFYQIWTKDNWYFKFGCKPFIKTLRKE